MTEPIKKEDYNTEIRHLIDMGDYLSSMQLGQYQKIKFNNKLFILTCVYD